MACYYLVISSTHLSNGHYRSIKGVFRGPLCKSNGPESPDYAKKEKAIAKALGDLKANFYCQLCDKQYHKYQEFDNHINSYDHAHKQRLKELKQREFARNVSSKSWKDEKKQKRALKRLHHLAQLKLQRDSDDRKGPKLRSTNKGKNKLKIHSCEFDPKPGKNSTPITTSISFKSLSSTGIPTHHQIRHEKHPLLTKPSVNHRGPRAGVSFCFSRRSQLKLDSCASVFSDGLEETNDYQEIQRHRHRLALEALWSCASSPRTPSSDEHDLSHDPPSLDWEDGDAQTPEREAQKGSSEIQTNYCTNEPENLGCPDMHSPGADWKPAGSEDGLLYGGQRSRAEEAYGGSVESECLKCPCPTVCTDGQDTLAQGKLQIHKGSHHYTFASSQCDIMQNGDKLAEDYIVQRVSKNDDTGSFLDVLSKDGSVTKWPFKQVRFTSEEPNVSYSCNPLCFYFKHKEVTDKSTTSEEADFGVADQSSRAGSVAQHVPGDKLGILKPKRHKHKRKEKKRRRKLEAAWIQQQGSVLKTCSQTDAGGHFEFQSTSQNKQACTKRRHKPGKRKRSVRDETSNETDTPGHSLKSIVVCSLSTPAGKRKKCQMMRRPMSELRTVRRRPLHYSVENTTGRWNNYQLYNNPYKSNREAASTPNGDLTSGGEWPVYHMGRVFNSPRTNSSRKKHSQTRSSTDSYNFTHYRLGRDFKHVEQNWQCTDIHNQKKYSTVCSNRNESYSIRRHKRFLNGHKCSDHRIPHTGRQLFYRVHDSPEPQPNESHWRNERLSPIGRRYKERDGYTWSSPERTEDLWYNKPVNIRSPSSSSSTTISELSADSLTNSLVRTSPTAQRQKHCSHSEWHSDKLKNTTSLRSSCKKRKNSPACDTSTDIVQPMTVLPGVVKEDTHTSTAIPIDKLAENPKEKKASFILSLPLIGKLPCIQKAVRKRGTAKDPMDSGRNQVQATSTIQSSSQDIPHVDKTLEFLQHKDGNDNTTSQSCLETSNDCCSDEPLTPDPNRYQMHSIKGQADNAGISCAKCSAAPISGKPITFTEDEIEKYRQLQLQAQQHIEQQRHLQEQESADMTQSPNPPDQTSCLPFTMFQPSQINTPHPSPVALLPPVHLPLSYFGPPVSAALFPALPATVLAGRPIQLFPASSLHPIHAPRLTLHALHPSTLLPSMLSPVPMAAATAAAVASASTLQIHPLLHPLFCSQDLQCHPGPAS